MALPKHVDRDLIVSVAAMAGISEAAIRRSLAAGKSPQAIWDSIMRRNYGPDVRNALKRADKYLQSLSGGDLKGLLMSRGVSEGVANWAISRSKATDTIGAVLQRVAEAPGPASEKGNTRQMVAGVFGITETLGATGGLNKSKQQYMGAGPAGAASPVTGSNRAPLKSNTGGLLSGVTPMGAKESTADLQARAGVGFMTNLGAPAAPAKQPPGGPGAPTGDLGTLGDGAGAGDGTTTTAGATVPAAPPPLSAAASDAEVEAYIRNNFGFAAWALDEPEIRQVLVDFTRDMRGYEFTADQLEAKLLGTQWWQDKNKNARARIREKNEDPATYNQGILNEADKLQALMEEPGSGGGFNISPTRLQEMARTSYKLGWTNAEMRAALAAEFDYDPTGGAQTASALVGRLKTLAGSYLVPLSEATIDEWGRAMIAGTANEDTIKGYLREQSKVLLPAFAAQIDAGISPDALVEPYRQTIAKEMGSNPTEIDFLDPKWNRFISHRDPKTGQPMAMDPYEIQKTIRTDATYRWDQTAGARGQATEFVTKLAERFGQAG